MSNLVPRRATAVLCAAGTLFIGAFAAAPSANAATIYACAKKRGGAARIVGQRTRCRRSETKLSWNSVGPAGSRGSSGKNGKNGSSGANGANGQNGAIAGYFASGLAPAAFTGGKEVTILSKTIPAGNYLVFAKTVISSSAEEADTVGVTCELVDGVVRDTSQWSGVLAKGTPPLFVASSTLSLQSALSTSASSTLTLRCTDTSSPAKNLLTQASLSQIAAVQTTQNS